MQRHAERNSHGSGETTTCLGAARRSSVRFLLHVNVNNRPGQLFPGTDEAEQCPARAAIATPVADATGARIRDLPLSQSLPPAALGP
jgi:hypothetical protein